MLFPLRRRTFLQGAVGAAIALHWPTNDDLVADSQLAELLAQVDPALRATHRKLAAGKDAWPLLDAAGRQLTELPDSDDDLEDCFSTTKPDSARDRLYADWLDTNRNVLDACRQAVAAGDCEYPDVPWSDDRSAAISRFRNLSRLLRLAAQRSASQGDMAEAVRNAHSMTKLARLMKNGGGFVVEYLVALAIEGDANTLVRDLANRPTADEKLLRLLLNDFPEEQVWRNGLRRAIQSEYCNFLLPGLPQGSETLSETLDGVFEWKEYMQTLVPRDKFEGRKRKVSRMLEGHPKPYDPVDTLRRASAEYLSWLRDLELPWAKHLPAPQPQPADLAAWPAPLNLDLFNSADPDEVTDAELDRARESLRKTANPLGRMILDASMLDSHALHRAGLSNQARYEGTRLYLAIALFRARSQRLPASIDELVAARILPRAPLDPFCNQPLRYTREARAIWSVGWDGNVSPEAVQADEYDVDAKEHLWRLGFTAN